MEGEVNIVLSALLPLQESSPGGGGIGGLVLPMVAIFAIMYFLIWRPQAKKQKQHQAVIDAIKKGDKIITSGGIYGTIAGVKDKEKTFIVKIDENVKIEMSKSAIAKKLD